MAEHVRDTIGVSLNHAPEEAVVTDHSRVLAVVLPPHRRKSIDFILVNNFQLGGPRHVSWGWHRDQELLEYLLR
jgi:hypothetical protein